MIIQLTPLRPDLEHKASQWGKQALSGLTLGLVALISSLGMTAKATTITFGNAPLAYPNNSDLPVSFGSFAASDAVGWITSDGTGATPNIGLTWGPTGGTVPLAPDIDILEFHSANTFVNAGFTAPPVLQLDIDLSNHSVLPGSPTVLFNVSGGFALNLISLQIGNATDQLASELPYSWTLSLIRQSDSAVVSTYTTALLSAGSLETATFNYTGDVDMNYTLRFFANTDPANGINANPRTGIDNLKFSQVVPEPTSLTLLALSGLGLIVRGTKRQ